MDKTRMGKRAASLLLSLVMMLSLLPTAAYATMADGVDTQGAIVSENGTDVSDDSNSSGGTGDLQVEDSEGNGDTGAQQVGGSSGSGTADDTTGAEGGADPTDSVNGNDSADPQDDGDAVLPTAANVAKVGDTEYATLEAAIAALSSSSYTLELLDETAWDLATPVYWAAGSESGYAATLADALTAAYKANGDITIVCRPGTDVGKLTHGHVADDITIYGNNAYISSGECELEVDTFMYSRDTGKQVTTGGAYLEKDITVTAYELDNLGVWGQRHTDHKVTVNLTDCDSVNGITVQRVYISGTTGVNDITLTGCDFGTRATSVYSNADGAVVIDNCSFTGAQVPVNFNHKANGAQTVTVRNSTFTGCGDNGDWKQFAAPVRFVNSGSGKMDTTVGTCTFTDTVGGNGDILLGDGRVDQSSNDVKLNVANTEATVQAQQPGYYGDGGTTDESKQGTKNVAASDTLTTSVTQLMPSSELTNYVTVSGIKGFDGTKFATFADAYAAIKPVVATLGLGQETPADAAAFDAVFTDISTDGKATLTYTITGNVTYDETGLDHLLTMGRSSSHYLTNERHLINFKFVGAEADRGATLTVNSNITLPYEWWGEKITTSISFENLTITGSAPSGLFAYQSFFEGIDFKVNNCTLKGIKIYNCANVGGSYTITNSKLDGTGAAKDAYAIHLQGNDTAPLNILIENNQISGYDRGVNIDQATAIATISGNSISINDNDRSCIQLTQLAKTTVSGNSMTLTGGNAITLHGNLAAGSKIEVIGNNITGTGYLIYDAAKGTIDLTYTDNTVSDTIDTTKGVYGGKEYKVSENVANALKSDTTTYVAEVKGVKYDSLQAAINAATEKATVILLADTRENVTINKNRLTLDLNGHTLNGGTVKGKPALTVTARNVIVKDSSAAKTGTIMREDTAENSGASSHYVIDIQGDNAFLKFEGGNVKNNRGNTQGKGASLVRVGDDSVSAWPQLTIAGGTFTQDNFIVIKVDRGTFYLTGGTLNSANSYAIEDWHRATIKGGTVNGTVAVWTYSGGHNSDLSIIGGTINGDVTSVNYGSAEGKVAKVSITGGTVNGALDTRSYDPSTNELTSIDDATKATIAVTGGTFSKDPTKYVVEDSAITPNADGTFGVAKAYLAKVGDTSYYTMEEAFKAQTASGEAIVLLRDYTTGSTFNSGSINRTVDLNGHTWTCTGTDANSAAFEINYPDATLTVKNGKVVSSQLVGLIPSAMGGTIKYDNSSLVFDGVEMTTTAHSGIETNGNNTNDTVTLKNSTLNVPNGFGIYFPSSGTLTIDNSVINAKTMGVQVCAGSLNISGAGTAITVSGDGIDKTINDGAIEDGAAISIVERIGYKGLAEIKVEGGKFTAKGDNAAVKAYKWENQTESDFTQAAKVSISGGTFSSAVDKSLCAEGFIPTKNADGTYGVKEGQYVAQINSKKYETLADAIRLATKGKTITLLADVEQNTQLTINKSITLDLNGKTIRNTVDIWGDKANAILSITNGAKVTITGNGTIDAKENDCYTINVVKGDLTIENGTFYGNVSVVQVEEGTLSVKGGTFDLHQKWEGSSKYLFNCIDKAYVDGSANVAISGGTFVGFDPNVSPEQKVDGKTPSFAAPGVGITRNENGSFTAVDGMTAQILDKDGNSVNAYNTLAEAVAAAQNGQTVRLLANVAESSIKVNANITIDLNKMTVTGSFVTYGEVTIQNGTIDVPDGETNYAYGKLTLADVDITGKAASSSLLSVNYNGSVTIDKDSTIVADSAKGDYPAVFIKGQDDSGKTYAPELNIYGTVQSAKTPAIQGNGTDRGVSHVNVFEGAVVKSESLAVYLPQPCEVNITGGLVEGYCGIGIKSGTLNISGGTVRGVANENVIGDEYSQTNGISYDGSAIMIDSYIGYAGQVQINISGNAVVESKYSTAIREIGNDKSQTNLVGLDITGGTVLGAKDTDAVLVRDVTAKDVNISGGEFSSIVKKEYCAPGFTPVTTANSEGRYGVEIGKFTVKVTSRTTGSDSPVANVAGGDSDITYAQGTTVTASAISGYNFVGWFVNEYTGTPYSTDLTCKVKPTDDWTMIAVYEPISGGKFWLTVTASEFTVNGGAVQDSYLYEQFAGGASVTVNFTGSENFLYWVNASNKVVSTEKSYTFIMGSETTLKAVYGKARQNQATVVFISHSDQIISPKAYTTNDTIQFPVPPIKMGCTFTGWSMTEADIRAAMANNSGIIQVRALYTEPSIACKVTVVYPEGTDNQVVNAVVGKAIDVTAKDIEGKTFSYWTDNAGNILGYTKTLKLAPSGDMTVKAVYDQAAEAKPVITMSEVSATTANESYVVTFMATRAVPNGYKVVKQGILWSRDAVCGEDGAAAYMQFDSNGKLPDGVRAYIGNNLDLNGVTRYDITTKYNDRTFYGRGYMVLESDAGELLYIYTDTIASGSYDSLTK